MANNVSHPEPAQAADFPALVERAKAGDKDAMTALYETSCKDVFRTIRAMVRTEDEALDIEQDTYVQAFTHLDQLKEAEKFRAWIRSVAVNQTRLALRRQSPILFTELVSNDEEDDPLPAIAEQADLSPDASPELARERRECAAYVQEILNELTPGQRMLVGMYYYDQLPMRQIAEELEINLGTVKSQLSKTRKKIESAVLRLEARGVKLYGLTPLPFLFALLKRVTPAEPVERRTLNATLSAATHAAEPVAVHVGRGFFETVAGRLILGVIVAGVIGGGAFGYRWLNEHRSQKQDPTLPTDEEQLLVIPTAPTAPEERVSDVWGSDLDTEEDLVTEPEPTEPPTEPTEPEPTAPEPSEPQPTDPKPADPKPSDPQPSEPQPTDPEPTDPQPTDPEPSELPTENEDLDVGGCGADLIWTYDKTSGVLTITGSGEMLDYDSRIPWQPYRETLTEVVFPSGLTHVGACAFHDCTALKSVVLPDGVEQLSFGVFYGCTGLERVVLPARMTKIEDRAFLGCSSLEELPLPNGLTQIGEEAFYKCSSLKELPLPDRLTQIGDFAFGKCAALTRVKLPESLTELGTGAFYGCAALTEIVLPSKLSSVPDHAFGSCSSLSQLAFPAGLTSIGKSAFSCCYGLQSVTLPESLQSIADHAFWGCSNLKSVTLPESLRSIEDHAFGGCNLESISFPASLNRIGASAFDGCDALRAVRFSEGLTSIGADAFLCCSALNSVTIPSSVTEIGAHALGYLGNGTEEYVKLSDFTIYGAAGSAAQAYAEENGFPFITK